MGHLDSLPRHRNLRRDWNRGAPDRERGPDSEVGRDGLRSQRLMRTPNGTPMHTVGVAIRLARVGRTGQDLVIAIRRRNCMRTLSAKCANGFGRTIDLARVTPVLAAGYGRPIVVVLSVEECERPKALDEYCR